ncbi:MAG: CopG family transcriptional regulator [Spirochaetales bacterium]|nr:CopG family transcriptional regulator [Spirochaetales bacterium]
MKQKIKYSAAPDEVRESLVNSVVIEDFLPPPELLIPKEKTTKVTIALSTKSINFFKEVSKETHVSYQQMIRKVLDTYTDHYAKWK